jgi:hypothetical protein
MPTTIQALKRNLKSQIANPYKLNDAFHDSPLWKRIPDKLVPRKYLKETPSVVRHTTLEELWDHGSPHLLEHDWVRIDMPGRQEVCQLSLESLAFLKFPCRRFKPQALNLATPLPKSAKPRGRG